MQSVGTGRMNHQIGSVESVTYSPSPKIESVEWAAIVVEGLGAFKDVKLWPCGGREWDCAKTSTQHVPGIQPSDVEELLDHGAEVVVLSRGMELRLLTCPETLDFLASRGCEVHVEPTQVAALRYNQLSSSQPAGCLIHSTC
jgi:hypothetical protein